MENKEISRLVAKTFGKLKRSVLGLTGLRVVELREDDVLVRAGRPAAECFLVIDGIVVEYFAKATDDVIRLVGPGGLLGVDELFASRRATCSHTLAAGTSCRVLAMSLCELEELARRDGAFAEELYRLMVGVAGERTLRGRFLRGNNGTERAEELMTRFGWSGRPPLKWKTIASYLGMNICALSRSVARLRNSRGL